MGAESENGVGVHVFGNHAEQMASFGLAVVPLGRDRKPKVAGFNRWSHRPSELAVADWALEHPDANIGIIPGLSGVWVADVDSADQVGEVVDLLGPTPLHVRTSRGEHLYYADPRERLPGTLRKYGLDVDLMAGNSIVIAPPSIHESGHIYRLDGADWSALGDLPRPNAEQLHQFLKRQSKKTVGGTEREMRDGSRKQGLNDFLCSQVAYCDNIDELLDVARTKNSAFTDRGHEPLDDAIVIERAKKVWADFEAGKLEQWMGGAGVAKLRRSDIEELTRLNSKGAGDAFMLLAKLKIEHGARCRRNETFCITPQSMVRDGVIPAWSRHRYMRARDLLIKAKLVEKISSFSCTRDGRRAAQYRLPQSK